VTAPALPPVATPDGAEVLDDVRAALAKYVILPSEEVYTAVTLWVAATHAVGCFEHATRLAVHSAMKRCGKSRLLEVIDALAHRPVSTTNISVPALFRMIDSGGDDPPTLILDEADRLFGSSKMDEDNRELIGLLNNGFRRGAETWRCVGPTQIPTPFSNYAMVVIAGIGRKPDTIEDRAVNVTMRRRMPGEAVAKFRLRTDKPTLYELRDRLAAWATASRDRLAAPVTDLPAQLEDRAEDAWEPLLAVADVAGGPWPILGRAAAVLLAAEAAESDAQHSEGIRLLADVHEVFDGMPHVSFLKTNVLLTELRKVEDAPWGEQSFSARALALKLRDHGIRPRHNTAKTERGYHLADFRDAFRRYLPSEASEPSGTPSDLHKQRDGSLASDGSNRPEDLNRPDETAGQSTCRTARTGRTATPDGHDDDRPASELTDDEWAAEWAAS
jgi:hypothetical protein